MVVLKDMDLITTIEDDAEVENFSEDSDAEVEVFQANQNIFIQNNFLFFLLFLYNLVSTNKVKTQKNNRI